MTVGRLGSYGTVEVDWLVGFPSADAPLGFLRGALSPEAGTLRMANGVDSQLFMVQVRTGDVGAARYRQLRTRLGPGQVQFKFVDFIYNMLLCNMFIP